MGALTTDEKPVVVLSPARVLLSLISDRGAAADQVGIVRALWLRSFRRSAAGLFAVDSTHLSFPPEY